MCTPIYGAIKLEYSVTKAFTQEEIDDLNAIFIESDSERVKRYHNLFYLDMRHNEEKLKPYGEKLAAQFGYKSSRCYFLEYTTGSFARQHRDATEQSAKTIITLIHTSPDLVGGDTIIIMPHFKRDDYEYDINRYIVKDESDHCQGAEIIPVVVPMSLGESVIYDQHLQHEVSLVQSGIRRVFVTWLT